MVTEFGPISKRLCGLERSNVLLPVEHLVLTSAPWLARSVGRQDGGSSLRESGRYKKIPGRLSLSIFAFKPFRHRTSEYICIDQKS